MMKDFFGEWKMKVLAVDIYRNHHEAHRNEGTVVSMRVWQIQFLIVKSDIWEEQMLIISNERHPPTQL